MKFFTFTSLAVLFIVCSLHCILAAEQNIASRKLTPQYGAQKFKLPSPFNNGDARAPFSSKNSAKQTYSQSANSGSDLASAADAGVLSVDNVLRTLRRSARDTRRELTSCYKQLARAEDNYDRLGVAFDILLNHKRAVLTAGAAVGMMSVYSATTKSPFHAAASVADQARNQEIAKWGRRIN